MPDVMLSLQDLLQRAEDRRAAADEARHVARAALPLRYWHQHAHLTTPASDETRATKAVEAGTAPMGRLLARLDISAAQLAERLAVPAAIVADLLGRPRRAPLV